LEFHRRVRDGYLQMVRAEPDRWVCIDAAREVEAIQADIWKVVSRLGE
jgi:dTMP kinase